MGVRQAVWRQRLWAEPDMRIVSAGTPDGIEPCLNPEPYPEPEPEPYP